MEQLITQIAGIQNTPNVAIDKRAVIVMCADNGIVEEGVTQTGQEVTAVVSCNMADGISSVCKMADYAYAEVIPVNIGNKKFLKRACDVRGAAHTGSLHRNERGKIVQRAGIPITCNR